MTERICFRRYREGGIVPCQDEGHHEQLDGLTNQLPIGLGDLLRCRLVRHARSSSPRSSGLTNGTRANSSLFWKLISRVTTITEACGFSRITSMTEARSRSSRLAGSSQGNESDIFGSTGIAITVLMPAARVAP